MKFFKVIAAAVISASLAGCSESQLDYRNAQVNNGLIYAGAENKPFTGLVTNVPETFIRADGGYIDTLYNLNQTLKQIRSDQNIYIGRTFVCDIEVEKGFISGQVSCYQTRSRTLRYTAEYKGGNMNGKLQIFAVDGKTSLAEAVFDNGTVNGDTKFWSPNTGKLIYLRSFSNGKVEGTVENYDQNTGETVYRGKAKNGVLHGAVETFTPQGKRTSQIPYEHGVPNGIAYEWDPGTGNMTKLITFDNGAKTGESKEWQPDGTLISHRVYKFSALVEDKLKPVPVSTVAGVADPDQCVDDRIAEFRESMGEEALIKYDQMAEWESECGSQG